MSLVHDAILWAVASSYLQAHKPAYDWIALCSTTILAAADVPPGWALPWQQQQSFCSRHMSVPARRRHLWMCPGSPCMFLLGPACGCLLMLTGLLHCPEGALEVRLLHASACEHRTLSDQYMCCQPRPACMHQQADMLCRDTQVYEQEQAVQSVYSDSGLWAQCCTPCVLIEAGWHHLFTDHLQTRLTCQTLNIL